MTIDCQVVRKRKRCCTILECHELINFNALREPFLKYNKANQRYGKGAAELVASQSTSRTPIVPAGATRRLFALSRRDHMNATRTSARTSLPRQPH